VEPNLIYIFEALFIKKNHKVEQRVLAPPFLKVEKVEKMEKGGKFYFSIKYIIYIKC
jgi:hypothetical protein